MVAFSSVKPGDILWEVTNERAGNTMMRRQAVRSVRIVEVHEHHVVASWNGNPPRRYGERAVRSWKRNKPESRRRTHP